MTTTSVLDALATALARSLGARVRRHEPLGARTTYRVGGTSALWVEGESDADLVAVHQGLAEVGEPVPVLVLGKGSNLLVADAGFDGLSLTLGTAEEAYGWIRVTDATVRAGAAAGYPVVARRTAALGLHGLEWAVGVPGSVGGALRMNAGGHGSETARVLSCFGRFDLATGLSSRSEAAELGAAYRRTALGPADVVVWAEFSLSPATVESSQAEVAEVVRWRRANQPGGSNAGSVFTNPATASAGRLVEEAGLKGMRLGTAMVSDKHANFIQADENGSADDVRRLIDHVRSVVAAHTGVELVPEVRMVGFPDTSPPLVDVGPGASGRARRPDAHDPDNTSPSSGGRG